MTDIQKQIERLRAADGEWRKLPLTDAGESLAFKRFEQEVKGLVFPLLAAYEEQRLCRDVYAEREIKFKADLKEAVDALGPFADFYDGGEFKYLTTPIATRENADKSSHIVLIAAHFGAAHRIVAKHSKAGEAPPKGIAR